MMTHIKETASATNQIKHTSGLLVKVLACNRKVAGSSPTRYRLFFAYECILSSTLKNEVFITASFGGDVKPSVPGSWLILATLLF